MSFLKRTALFALVLLGLLAIGSSSAGIHSAKAMHESSVAAAVSGAAASQPVANNMCCFVSPFRSFFPFFSPFSSFFRFNSFFPFSNRFFNRLRDPDRDGDIDFPFFRSFFPFFHRCPMMNFRFC